MKRLFVVTLIRFTAAIQRSQGRSVIAAAAYQPGTRLEDQRLLYDFDYTGKRYGIAHTVILAPENTPADYLDRERLWNAAGEGTANARRSDSDRATGLARVQSGPKLRSPWPRERAGYARLLSAFGADWQTLRAASFPIRSFARSAPEAVLKTGPKTGHYRAFLRAAAEGRREGRSRPSV